MAASVDKLKFQHRSGGGCSHSHYVFVVTQCCNSVFLEDTELSELYFDPEMPMRLIEIYDKKRPCPLCNSADWDYDYIAEYPKENKWQCACQV